MLYSKKLRDVRKAAWKVKRAQTPESAALYKIVLVRAMLRMKGYYE
jgi:hypothetical protein